MDIPTVESNIIKTDGQSSNLGKNLEEILQKQVDRLPQLSDIEPSIQSAVSEDQNIHHLMQNCLFSPELVDIKADQEWSFETTFPQIAPAIQMTLKTSNYKTPK